MGQNRLRLIYLHATGGGEKHEAYTSTSVRTVGGRVASCMRAWDIRKFDCCMIEALGSDHES